MMTVAQRQQRKLDFLAPSIVEAIERGRIVAAPPGSYLIELWEWPAAPAPKSIIAWLYDPLAEPFVPMTVDGPRGIWDAVMQPNGSVLHGETLHADLNAYIESQIEAAKIREVLAARGALR